MTINPSAHISAVFTGENGRTRAAHLSQKAPLKIARTFARADGGLDLCLMDASPGMLAGDRYLLDFALQAGARVAVTTQGFTRVHPSSAHRCELQTRLSVAGGAVLHWLPEPLMLYANADLRAHTTVALQSGATLMASEIWCAGRTARGEAFDFARFVNRWKVNQNGAPLWASSLDLAPKIFEPRNLGAWASSTHSGNFWVWSDAAPDELLEAWWEIIENQTAVYAGASAIAGGAMVSMLGRRAHDLSELGAQLRAATLSIITVPKLRSTAGK